MPYPAFPVISAPTRGARTRSRIVRQVLQEPDGTVREVAVNLGESSLAWLHARGMLADRLYRAGELLRQDWEKAGLGPNVTMQWDASPLAGGRRGAPTPTDPSFARLSARERLDGALAAAGPGLADIAWRVACAGEGLSAAEKALGWPGRAGKLVLGMALERVADFYRIA